MQSKYMRPRGLRREGRNLAGRFRGGKLAPVIAVPFRESESGMLQQRVAFELDPIAGRMITDVTGEVVSVYVPALAIDALKNPSDDYPGNSEVFRQKLLSGNPVFGLENETELSQRLGIVPRSVNGTKKVNEVARLAHNAAVNYLRQRKYVKAALVDAANAGITPALIGRTVLDRLNGVLDPEDRVNGHVDFTGDIKINGIGVQVNAPTYNAGNHTIVTNQGIETHDNVYDSRGMHDAFHSMRIAADGVDGTPMITGDMSSSDGVSLSDFYQAERMDRITREMRRIVDDNPEWGEELVTRWASGLNVDVGKQPFVIYRREFVLRKGIKGAMDGPNLDLMQTTVASQVEFTVPVPATEFGGVVITFASVKPDETLASQPHPFLSSEWGAINYVSEEMAIDPVPVTIRDLDADCDQADENSVALYVGPNHMLRNYENYGFTRNTDLTTVENKTALWQLEVPMSVTPESVIYPDDISHYPFADQTAEVVQYQVMSVAKIATPRIFGPTPVEELAQIETDNIFEDDE